MTDLQLMYAKHRLEGRGHYAAVRTIARDTGIDEGTVQRCLRRAERTNERENRRA